MGSDRWEVGRNGQPVLPCILKRRLGRPSLAQEPKTGWAPPQVSPWRLPVVGLQWLAVAQGVHKGQEPC